MPTKLRTIADLGPHVAQRYPYESQFITVNGWRMHHVDLGPADAPPVLLLHGNPTWGYLWRDTIPPLLDAGYRVVVPDQIGFGLSEHPHSPAAHGLDNHAANIVALVDQLGLHGCLLVVHDWGGPTGLAALLTRPDRFAATAIMSTWAWNSPSAAFHRLIVPWRMMHAPLVGPYLLGRHGAMPGRGIYLSVLDRDRYQHDAREAYEAVLPDPDDRRLTWQWPRSTFIGRSGRPFPSGVEIAALVPGLEPLDTEQADLDLWAILTWVLEGVGDPWTAEALTTTGRIYRIPAVDRQE